MVSLPCKHGHCVMKYVASPLYTLIEPVRPMLLFINWYRVCLSTTVVYRIDKRHVEFTRLGEMVRVRISTPKIRVGVDCDGVVEFTCGASADHQDLLPLRLIFQRRTHIEPR